MTEVVGLERYSCFRVLLSTYGNPTYSMTRPKFATAQEAQAYAAWLAAREPHMVRGTVIEGLKNGRPNATFQKGRSKDGIAKGRLMWHDDQPGDDHHQLEGPRDRELGGRTTPTKAERAAGVAKGVRRRLLLN